MCRQGSSYTFSGAPCPLTPSLTRPPILSPSYLPFILPTYGKSIWLKCIFSNDSQEMVNLLFQHQLKKYKMH